MCKYFIHLYFLPEKLQNKNALSCLSRLHMWFYFHILHDISHLSANMQSFRLSHVSSSPLLPLLFQLFRPTLPPLLLLLPSPLSSSLLPIWDNKKNISKAESAQSPRYTHAHTHALWYNPTLKLCLPFFFLVLLLSKPRFPSVIFIWLFESLNNALRDRGTRSTWGEIGREK